jgi:hypothetical protein
VPDARVIRRDVRINNTRGYKHVNRIAKTLGLKAKQQIRVRRGTILLLGFPFWTHSLQYSLLLLVTLSQIAQALSIFFTYG